MEIMVEFAGLARVLTKRALLPLTLEEGCSYRQILQRLATMHPELVGNVIHPSYTSLQSSNMLNLNGRHMIQPDQMDQSPSDGDRLIFMSILAGG